MRNEWGFWQESLLNSSVIYSLLTLIEYPLPIINADKKILKPERVFDSEKQEEFISLDK